MNNQDSKWEREDVVCFQRGKDTHFGEMELEVCHKPFVDIYSCGFDKNMFVYN